MFEADVPMAPPPEASPPEAEAQPASSARPKRQASRSTSSKTIAAEPPHSLPLPTLVVTLDAKALTDTVNWLVGQVRDQQNSIEKVFRSIQEVDGETKVVAEKQAQIAESADQRFALLEKMAMRGGGGGGDSAAAKAGDDGSEGLPKALLGSDVEQLVRQMELDVSNLNIAVKKTNQYIKHQEDQQILRDQAQDELLKLELDSIKRQLETCLQDKDLELMRTNMLARIENIQNEVKEDLQRLSGDFKGGIADRMNEMASSIERIASSTEQQVRVLNDKVDANTEDDDVRYKDDQKKFAAVEKMMHQIARHAGVELKSEVDLSGDAAAEGATRSLAAAGASAPAAGAAAAVGGPALERLERRLERLAAELGVSLDGEAPPAEQSNLEPGTPGLPEKPKPLPTRVEQLEEKQTQLTQSLQENLGLVLPGNEVPPAWSSPESTRARSAASVAVQASAPPEPVNPPAAEERPATAGTHGQALRLDAIEARLREIGVAVGLEVPGDAASAPEGQRPATAMRPLPIRVDLLDAKMDEVATAVGVTPQELEDAALGEQRGTLAGRVMLSTGGEGQAPVSPRMAGIIASQEDRLVSQTTAIENLENKLNNEVNDAFREMDALKERVKALEGKAGVKPPPAAAAAQEAPKDQQKEETEKKRKEKEKEDKAQAEKKAAAPTETKAKDVAPGASSAEVAAVSKEVKELNKVCEELKSKIKKLTADMHQLKSGDGATIPPPDSPKDSSKPEAQEVSAAAVQRAESAAEAAEKSAEAASKLRQELEEILRAIEVPATAGLFGPDGGAGDLFEDGYTQTAGGAFASEGEQAQAEAESAAQYMERQMEIETRLEQLEDQLNDQLENMTQQPEGSEMLSGMKLVIKDVRTCLRRCELLFQLPEIKQFVNKFRRSLEVNAVLHERWLGPRNAAAANGPAAAANKGEDRPSSAGNDRRPEGKGMSRDQASSMPDLKAKDKSQASRSKKGGGDGKKKPFRTVVDWCRPHTPLSLDPQYRKNEEQRPSEGGGSGVTNLPPINR
eukprot:TRINITY_DN91554_c0_g1_i1.p1 TRINITY_DN91554_c0_g1~~TRINITY_DN91554_c0_g1_i1.p1  ORF type:complete len:1023 (+),score=383.02 TRINITY_DN91554_c0_g1_i1:164-3232(+)